MPSAHEILDGLTAVANEWRTLGIVWHVALGTCLLGLLAGWRPSKRLAGALVVAPMVSVSALAWW